MSILGYFKVAIPDVWIPFCNPTQAVHSASHWISAARQRAAHEHVLAPA
jgi:hypothetical protein